MMSKNKLPLMFLVLFIGVVLVIFVLQRENPGTSAYFGLNSIEESEKTEKEAQKIEKSTLTSQYGFDINLPKGATVSHFADGAGETILIKSLETKNQNEEEYQFEMQVYRSYLGEDITITVDRIKQDIPDMQIKDEKEVKVGGEPALAFIDVARNSREVWFVRDQTLYQISSNPEHDLTIAAILESWQWK